MAKTAGTIMRGGHVGWFRIVTILLDSGQVAAIPPSMVGARHP